MDHDELRLARALASPDAGIRLRTAQQLHIYLSSLDSDPVTQDAERALLRLWKALHYCLWLTDKTQTQNELSAVLAKGVSITPASVGYITAFFRTLMREWSNLDQYRVEKFYVLIRLMMREMLGMICSTGDKDKKMRMIAALEIEVLRKVPNGNLELERHHTFSFYCRPQIPHRRHFNRRIP